MSKTTQPVLASAHSSAAFGPRQLILSWSSENGLLLCKRRVVIIAAWTQRSDFK